MELIILTALTGVKYDHFPFIALVVVLYLYLQNDDRSFSFFQIFEIKQKSASIKFELKQYLNSTVSATEKNATELLSQKEHLENIWRSIHYLSKASDMEVVKTRNKNSRILAKELCNAKTVRKPETAQKSLDSIGKTMLCLLSLCLLNSFL